ncbi:hypothetical protein EO95_11655 [Methanosarcina sp. 1.H.T.1A.1]|uniref:biotin--[acetyl-CoA-carboxylase] ligase n=1 Tax=Methanosarcina sp. 1.H.T.1A.1 TaxID=1483602 RepID=UPI0006210AE3|nr:biotin--[acetyl-CoA-carboxylase] ligase [Methanosarcina sp. 1.H.T.1A.1]KKH92434.1 hypothetical protein EO95_11655 [Methanosarcina sp. 1.H.T.1A.1]
MSLKSEVLRILEENRNTAVSGQELANKLSVSRSAIWKAIQALKEEGYSVNATTNKGYQLSVDNDLLSPEGIEIFLNPKYKKNSITVYQSLSSTNVEAKKMAIGGVEQGAVILAEEQREGRGRLGKSFFSPAKTGIYMSIILCPKMKTSNAILITIASAVAVCRVIEKLTGEEPKIKWVNDILLNEKKICGILTEAVSDFESDTVENVIVGIGINVKTEKEQFPPELRGIATSLFPKNIYRNQLAAEIINELLDLYTQLEDKSFISEYKARSMVLGKDINYYQNGKRHSGRAIDINEIGSLIVQNEEGEIYALQSGEITIGSMRDEN